MENKRIRFCMLVMVLVFGMMVVGCNGGNNSNSNLDSALFGTWVHVEDEDVFTFNRNGTYSWDWDGDIETGTWSTSEGIITFTYDGTSDFASYTFSGGNLYLDGDGPYVKQ